MATYKIPNDSRQFSQVNDGDVAGNLWMTQNIDLKSNKGKINVSPRLIINQSSAGDAQLGRVSAFARYRHSTGSATKGYWAVCDEVLFKTIVDRPNGQFQQDTIASTPTDLAFEYSDMTVAPNGLLVSNGDNVYLFDGSAWTSYWLSLIHI